MRSRSSMPSSRARARALWIGWPILTLACLPQVDVDETRVDAPRILALRTEPAEGQPGRETTLRALVASADAEDQPVPEWAFCLLRRPLAELGPVNRGCLALDADGLVTAGAGLEVRATLPREGCRLFGPEVPPPEPGQPPGRSAEADLTGGYYQPLRVLLGDGPPSILDARIACGLAGGTPAEAREYRLRYQPNVHPRIEAVALSFEDEEALLRDESGTLLVPRRADVRVRVSWPDCGDSTPLPCEGAEPYLAYDAETRALVTRREALRVAWYSTSGRFRDERTGREGADRGTTSENVWTAPDTDGPARLWIVLRDERGGVAWEALGLLVE